MEKDHVINKARLRQFLAQQAIHVRALREYLKHQEEKDTRRMAAFYAKELCHVVAQGLLLYPIREEEALELIGTIPKRLLKPISGERALFVKLAHCRRCMRKAPSLLRDVFKQGGVK